MSKINIVPLQMRELTPEMVPVGHAFSIARSTSVAENVVYMVVEGSNASRYTREYMRIDCAVPRLIITHPNCSFLKEKVHEVYEIASYNLRAVSSS